MPRDDDQSPVRRLDVSPPALLLVSSAAGWPKLDSRDWDCARNREASERGEVKLVASRIKDKAKSLRYGVIEVIEKPDNLHSENIVLFSSPKTSPAGKSTKILFLILRMSGLILFCVYL